MVRGATTDVYDLFCRRTPGSSKLQRDTGPVLYPSARVKFLGVYFTSPVRGRLFKFLGVYLLLPPVDVYIRFWG